MHCYSSVLLLCPIHVQDMFASDAERAIAALHGKTLARNANPLYIEIVSQALALCMLCSVWVGGTWVCVCVCVCGVSLDSIPQEWIK